MNQKLDDVYQKKSYGILRFINSKVSSKEDARDILQDVFLALLEADAIRPIENVLGWLYRTANNKIVDWYRGKKNTALSLQELKHDFSPGYSIEELIEDAGIHIENDFLREVVLDVINDAVEELPAEQKSVFIRQIIEGETFRVISEETGIPINTLLSQKRRAILFLRKRLSEMKEYLEDL